MTASPTDDHASAERRIQELTKELSQAKGELAESREQQAATAEILKVISSSPMDLQRVFTEIAASAALLCDAYDVVIRQLDGDFVRAVAHHGPIPVARMLPLTRGHLSGRAVLDRRTIHIADLQVEAEEFPEARDIAIRLGFRTSLNVPLISAGEAIGTIAIRRTEVRLFSDKQIGLLENFANQAVIAIENTRLFEAEQASKRELQESLEYQTAMSNVLGVISRSPNELQPVLDAIVETAARLCQADRGAIWRLIDGEFQFGAAYATGAEVIDFVRNNPPPSGPTSMSGRTVIEKQTLVVEDRQKDLVHHANEIARKMGSRSMLSVPLMQQTEPLGVIALVRDEVRPFSPRQIALVEAFAAQAVIAIENTRLFEEVQARTRELTESLEQQTATADVLKVISRSALDVQRVLDALVESAARLCNAYDALILQVFGDGLRLVAHHGQVPVAGPVGQFTLPLGRGFVGGRAIIDRRTIQVADILAEADEYPESQSRALRSGWRTALCVPLVHAGEPIGVIFIRRGEVRPFTERQIELVNTFADQAVIAIENTRLFEEVQARTRELAKTVEDLEIASQHKNQFVANMSHELRTPLAAILGYAELIQEGFYGALPEKSMDALTRIRSNGKHLLGLINTVLDIAKIESGQFTLNMTEYAIESVVETVRAATESLAQNKKLTLTTSVDKSLPIGLGDEQRLTQVLLNLVGNAIKFTDAGEVSIAAGARNGHFAVSVTDTGPGIPLDQQGRIFDQFHQVDSSLTKAKGGTGLGLAIAKQIVEMHGGRIWVESTVGQGSTFRMELPLRATTASGAA
jgi:signal transduction histidine kinase